MDELWLIGRILFCALFIASGIGHLVDLEGSTRYATAKGIGEGAARPGVIASGIAFIIGGVSVHSLQRHGERYRLATRDGQCFEADQVIVATGLETPSRLARSAGLAWDNGICVRPEDLRTSDEHIHALGDCIAIDGQASRYIEPIARQARAIAARICGAPAAPYEPRAALVRVKTGSLPLTLH